MLGEALADVTGPVEEMPQMLQQLMCAAVRVRQTKGSLERKLPAIMTAYSTAQAFGFPYSVGGYLLHIACQERAALIAFRARFGDCIDAGLEERAEELLEMIDETNLFVLAEK